jgi:hypothetical protein
MKELNRIVCILCNYYNRRELNPVEMEILCEWLSESQAHEDFLTDLSDNAGWIKDSPSHEIHDLIKTNLILLYRD